MRQAICLSKMWQVIYRQNYFEDTCNNPWVDPFMLFQSTTLCKWLDKIGIGKWLHSWVGHLRHEWCLPLNLLPHSLQDKFSHQCEFVHEKSFFKLLVTLFSSLRLVTRVNLFMTKITQTFFSLALARIKCFFFTYKNFSSWLKRA